MNKVYGFSEFSSLVELTVEKLLRICLQLDLKRRVWFAWFSGRTLFGFADIFVFNWIFSDVLGSRWFGFRAVVFRV